MINLGSQLASSLSHVGSQNDLQKTRAFADTQKTHQDKLTNEKPKAEVKRADFKESLKSKDVGGNKPPRPDHSVDKKPNSSDPSSSFKVTDSEDVESKTLSENVRAEELTEPEKMALSKQTAIIAFLDKMQNELGVSPDEVLQAFSKLDADSLNVAPEISSQEFIQALDLNPEQELRANELYSEMLTWTAAAELSSQLNQQNQNANFEVLTPEQSQLKERLVGLDKMNDKFFVKNAVTSQSGAEAGLTEAAQTPNASIMPKDVADSALSKFKMDSMSQAATKQTAQSAAPQSTQPMNIPAGMDITNQQQSMPMMDTQARMSLTPNRMAPEIIETPDLLNQQMMFQPKGDSIQAPQEAIKQAAMNAYGQTPQQNMGQQSNSEQQNGEEATSDFVVQSDMPARKTDASGKPFIIQAPQPTEVESQANIRELINGAQAMVKKGGGEMKIKMTPEGLGELNLKVNVKNGDVSVEMVTNSNEAKKILEKGLSELKQGLTAQKLNVEGIKVESSQQSAQADMNNQQQDAEKNFQQRFLQDFRQQNENSRFGMMNLGGARQPGSHTMEEAANSIIDIQNRKKSADRRLDLVA